MARLFDSRRSDGLDESLRTKVSCNPRCCFQGSRILKIDTGYSRTKRSAKVAIA